MKCAFFCEEYCWRRKGKDEKKGDVWVAACRQIAPIGDKATWEPACHQSYRMSIFLHGAKPSSQILPGGNRLIFAPKLNKTGNRDTFGEQMLMILSMWDNLDRDIVNSILVLLRSILLRSIHVEMKVSEMWCLESEWSNRKSFLFAKLFMLFPFTFTQLGLYQTLWSWLTQIQNLYFSRLKQM